MYICNLIENGYLQKATTYKKLLAANLMKQSKCMHQLIVACKQTQTRETCKHKKRRQKRKQKRSQKAKAKEKAEKRQKGASYLI